MSKHRNSQNHIAIHR
uniref:Uncharacterized protein n=1 Tax=Arundo donax TaxID=35708 RepID=A0A0A8YA63_ARUDO